MTSSTGTRQYIAFLRALSNVGMKPFRDAMEDLGFRDVDSYGTSGNLLFNAPKSDKLAMERRIAARFETPVFIRTRAELGRIAREDPFGSIVLFLARSPTKARREAFHALEFEVPAPVLRGRTVYYVWPARLQGRRSPLDLERILGVQGTFRTARVVRRLYALMSAEKR